MGLGKTIQAIAACALLHRLGKAQRVLVVTPASLKAEWEKQIQRFTAGNRFGNRRITSNRNRHQELLRLLSPDCRREPAIASIAAHPR